VTHGVKTALESAIDKRTRRRALPSAGVLEFIGGAYLCASVLHSAGADVLLHFGRTRAR
jgi:hypothetical protein